MLLSHVTSTGVSMLAPTASTVTSLPASEAQQFIAVGSSALPPMPPPARILSTSSPLMLDTYSPARLMLRGQLDPEVLKLIPLRSVSLKMRMSPVPLSRRQTVDPDRTLASGKLSGSRCVLAAFHAHFTLEKSTVRVSGFADPLPAVDINSNSASAIPVVILIATRGSGSGGGRQRCDGRRRGRATARTSSTGDPLVTAGVQRSRASSMVAFCGNVNIARVTPECNTGTDGRAGGALDPVPPAEGERSTARRGGPRL